MYVYVYVCISVFGFFFCDRSKVYFDGVVIEGVVILEEFFMNEKKELQPTKNKNPSIYILFFLLIKFKK